MKKSGFKNKIRKPLKRTPFKRKGKPLARKTKLRVAGKSTVAQKKREIQALLREYVMKRDGGCILRMERCGREIGTEGAVFQADHLVSRANSASYADERLVVCVCRNCHAWKSLSDRGKKQYEALVKTILPESTVKLWERVEEDSWRATHKVASDWGLEIVRLKQLLGKQ